ncbi:DUF4192 family protein [Streptomyces chartreusis]|uniref:DUF4192 family protein n=1 Tax=Streptomyces chartreusis TaxID=1969 RepID=UPI0036BC3384
MTTTRPLTGCGSTWPRTASPRTEDFSPPLLTLYGGTSWLHGDTPTARVAFHAATSADPTYKMAGYLHMRLLQQVPVEEAAAIFRQAAAEAGY